MAGRRAGVSGVISAILSAAPIEVGQHPSYARTEARRQKRCLLNSQELLGPHRSYILISRSSQMGSYASLTLRHPVLPSCSEYLRAAHAVAPTHLLKANFVLIPLALYNANSVAIPLEHRCRSRFGLGTPPWQNLFVCRSRLPARQLTLFQHVKRRAHSFVV